MFVLGLVVVVFDSGDDEDDDDADEEGSEEVDVLEYLLPLIMGLFDDDINGSFSLLIRVENVEPEPLNAFKSLVSILIGLSSVGCRVACSTGSGLTSSCLTGMKFFKLAFRATIRTMSSSVDIESLKLGLKSIVTQLELDVYDWVSVSGSNKFSMSKFFMASSGSRSYKSTDECVKLVGFI